MFFSKKIANNFNLADTISSVWEYIPPLWPLKNFIAVNPLQGFESSSFENALERSDWRFETNSFSSEFIAVNRISIKWLQAFFDEGQAILNMPDRHLGLFCSWKQLAKFDRDFTKNNSEIKNILKALPAEPLDAIDYCFKKLAINHDEREEFLLQLLTTLPGWASYIKYTAYWQYFENSKNIATEYLAFRLAIFTLLCQRKVDIVEDIAKKSIVKNKINDIETSEKIFQDNLLDKIFLKTSPLSKNKKSDAQLVFCIDVRSEPFRYQLEQQGNYHTFGFPGFFGLPVAIHSLEKNKKYAACPVLIKPTEIVEECYSGDAETIYRYKNGNKIINLFKRCYQGLKYNFSTPFILAEAWGLFCGIWMLLKTIFPVFAKKIQNHMINAINLKPIILPDIGTISIEKQCDYAENALNLLGLMRDFSSLVVFVGHGSVTENNIYATALDCGACGGHCGANNAIILAEILNNPPVRDYLAKKNIIISGKTRFIAAQHNTTTDDVDFFGTKNLIGDAAKEFKNLTSAIKAAKSANNLSRLKNLPSISNVIESRSVDWAQTRPEWGLAKNAAFIIAPRDLTQSIALEGRCFLESYDWQLDNTGNILEIILTAPMIVAQWINAQYFFSTLNNIAYGSGSKITQNIVGKFGVIQGNASDLMNGLPLQSVYSSDNTPYHEPLRLTTVIYAPCDLVMPVILRHNKLKQLFSHGWIYLIVIDPNKNNSYKLSKSLEWEQIK